MTGRAQMHGGEAPSDPAAANLHTLTVSLTALHRLLGRRTADGALVPVDPTLIGAAIEAGRAEVARARAMLVEVPYDPTGPFRGSIDKLTAAVAEADGLLDMLQEMLNHLGE